VSLVEAFTYVFSTVLRSVKLGGLQFT